MDNEDIGTWMREIRESQGFTVEEVAARLRTTSERYGNIENGVVSVTIQFFAKFLLLFEIENLEICGIKLFLPSKASVASFKKLGNQIRESRIECGYSLRSLAAIVGTSHTALRNLENGSKRLTVTMLIRLDNALGKGVTVISGYLLRSIQEVSGGRDKSVEIAIGEESIQIPSEMPDLTTRRSYWQHKLAPILWCIAVKGRSTALDMGLLMGEEYKSLNSTLIRLEKLHLIESFRSHLLGPIKLYHLSDMGMLFCKRLGWAIKKSDLDVLFDGHQGREQLRHTAAVLYFAYKARLFRYTVSLLPSVGDLESQYQPDILISNGMDDIYFEVEMSAKNKSEKWKNQVDLQGFIAFSTISTTVRMKIKSQIKNIGYQQLVVLDTVMKSDLIENSI